MGDKNDFIERSTRMTVMGIIQLVIGSFCGFLALMVILGASMVSSMMETSIPQMGSAMMFSALIYAFAGAFFIWIGIGSLKKKRWVRPVALAIMVPGLVMGVVALVFLCLILPETMATTMQASMAHSRVAMPEGFTETITMFVTVFTIIFSAGIYLGIPLLHVLMYLPKDVKLTLEKLDTKPNFTEHRPLPVFAMALWLGLGAVMSLGGLLYSVFPFFGNYLTGSAGSVAVLVAAVILCFLAWQTINGASAGYWGTVIFFILMAVSYNLTIFNHPMSELVKIMGLDQLNMSGIDYQMMMEKMNLPTMIITNISFALVGGFLIFVRRFFKQKSSIV